MNISERKRAEIAQRKLEDQLRHSQKMEALGTLAGGVAHDFNNILASVIGNTELALGWLNPAHPTRRHLEGILAASGRAKHGLRFIEMIAHVAQPVNLAALNHGAISKHVAEPLCATPCRRR